MARPAVMCSLILLRFARSWCWGVRGSLAAICLGLVANGALERWTCRCTHSGCSPPQKLQCRQFRHRRRRLPPAYCPPVCRLSSVTLRHSTHMARSALLLLLGATLIAASAAKSLTASGEAGSGAGMSLPPLRFHPVFGPFLPRVPLWRACCCCLDAKQRSVPDRVVHPDTHACTRALNPRCRLLVLTSQ